MRGNSTISNRCRCHRTAAVDHRTSCRWRPPYAYVEAGKPVLGICRGYQLLNVFFGGSLYQHLPETPVHTNKQDFYIAHPVTAAQDSVPGKLYGTDFAVNSSHHQAVKELGEGLRATAWWDGKYVEAIEHTALPVLGVQWHPERMCCTQARPDTVDGLAFFRYFVGLCRR
ncbi:MAG: gamma-glutamyl-gamma-aminobutyrate hydrolase family protein [Ruminococcaceae bacterium]|nr:gamma-glutamyl-gamma-aminobutyrate hydrolase family protein [Oscillospiraceae bacterium]